MREAPVVYIQWKDRHPIGYKDDQRRALAVSRSITIRSTVVRK